MKLLALSSCIFPFNIHQNILWWLIDEDDSSRVEKGKILIKEDSLQFKILDKKRKNNFVENWAVLMLVKDVGEKCMLVKNLYVGEKPSPTFTS